MIKTGLKLLYENKDISQDIAPYLIDFRYTDHAHGQADDLQVRVEDRAGLWQGSWFPGKGARLTAAIKLQRGSDRFSLACGVFVVDEISVSDPPEQVSIKAASAAVTSSLRREKKTRAWQATSLETIAGQIAAENSMSFYYSADRFGFDRVDQREESDLGFLQRLCEENGLNLKVNDEKIIVFSGKSIEELPAVRDLTRGTGEIKRCSLTDKAHDIYRAATVIYFDPETKTEKSYTFVPPDAPPTGQTLKVNRRVESRAAAMRRAQTELRRANKNECSGELELIGSPGLSAGLNVSLAGWGKFDGKYFIETAVHACGGGGYTTSLTVRRVLGY